MSIQTKIAQLEGIVSKLPRRDQDFARSLISNWHKRRTLSEPQQVWVGILVDRAVAVDQPKPAAQVAASDMNLVKLHELFDKAKSNHIVVPRLHMQMTDGKKFTVSAAPATGKNPGAIYVQHNDKYYGKITREGRFEIPHYVERNPELEGRVAEVGENPSHAGKVHGHKLRWCMFCARELKTVDSLHYGYGPICAEKWELEWGEAKHRIEEEKTELTESLFADAIARFGKTL